MLDHQKSRSGKAVARTVRSTIVTEILPDEGWEVIAAHELQRLRLEAAFYRHQLDGRAGRVDLEAAVTSLEAARQAILTSVEERDRGASSSPHQR